MAPSDQDHRDIYTVGRLNNEVRSVLEGSFPLIWIEGEISNLAAPRSGHLYFSLKDAHAQVRCALFRAQRQLLRIQPSDGEQVLARARVGFYEPRGEFQLIVEHLEPAGRGAAQREFEQLKQRLQTEGLFDPAHKRALPAYPKHLGVITSPTGAAIRDVLQVLRRRAPQLAITIFPTQVQGTGAADEIVEALRIAEQRADCDVLLLTRGGGALEDLAAFNDERLARLIAALEIPLVSAIGHEVDFTIADFVADRRAPTPSAAAELISPDSSALRRLIHKQDERLKQALRRRLQTEQQQLLRLDGRLQRAAPRSRLRQQQQRVDDLDLRLARSLRIALTLRGRRLDAATQRLAGQGPARRLSLLRQRYAGLPERLRQAWLRGQRQRNEHLAATSRQLNSVSPLATMQRGYAVLRAPATGKVVTTVVQVDSGDRLEALLADGRIEMKVDEVQASDSKPTPD